MIHECTVKQNLILDTVLLAPAGYERELYRSEAIPNPHLGGALWRPRPSYVELTAGILIGTSIIHSSREGGGFGARSCLLTPNIVFTHF